MRVKIVVKDAPATVLDCDHVFAGEDMVWFRTSKVGDFIVKEVAGFSVHNLIYWVEVDPDVNAVTYPRK